MTKDQILGALPSLDKTALEAIHAMTGALLGGHTGAVDAALPLQAQTIFDALGATLGAQITYASIAGTKTGKLYLKRVPDFVKFLNAHFHGWDSNKITELALLRMMFGLIRDDLVKRDVTPSLGMIVSNMIRINDVFEAAFPGYLAAGLVDVIMKSFK